MKKSILTVLTLILFLSITVYIQQSNKPVTATKQTETASQQSLETYEYIVTSINKEGITGDSTKDDTGIFLTHQMADKYNLQTGDKIKVWFPKDDYETITKISKVNQ
ncbi:hypothetical protein V7128_02090 [Neobacillus vireti]|uniref:hypothetical protein n=1 Tax=Neobacillus vireti TaxID=220686 RepID=UPI002FFE903A